MNKNVVEHKEYGFYHLEPIPSQDEVDEFYRKEFYDANQKYFNNSSILVQEEQEGFFNSKWERIHDVCSNIFKSDLLNKTVFDIGFGFAKTLLYLNDKVKSVSGIEPSIEGYQYAISKGLDVFNGSIEDFSLVEGKKFDIVLLLNVLEHLRDPIETINNVKNQLLAPDGILVIDVPNDFNDFQTVANKEYQLSEWWVVRPNHINYFSPSSLSNLLSNNEYKIAHIESSFPIDMFLLMGDIYINNNEVGSQCHKRRVLFEENLIKNGHKEKLYKFYEKLAELDLGRNFSVFARPKN